jgi:hypothetical protein
MRAGDLVVYSPGHYAWLVSAGRWPRGLDRHRCVGVVIQTKDDHVQVEWPDKRNGVRILTHISSNIEAAG